MNIFWYDTINVRKSVKESLNFVYKEISVGACYYWSFVHRQIISKLLTICSDHLLHVVVVPKDFKCCAG